MPPDPLGLDERSRARPPSHARGAGPGRRAAHPGARGLRHRPGRRRPAREARPADRAPLRALAGRIADARGVELSGATSHRVEPPGSAPGVDAIPLVLLVVILIFVGLVLAYGGGPRSLYGRRGGFYSGGFGGGFGGGGGGFGGFGGGSFGGGGAGRGW